MMQVRCGEMTLDEATGKQGDEMTKEAMIKVLRYKAEHIKTKIRPEFFREVADMLEQEPCEDAISRQTVIDMAGLSEWFDSSDSYNEFVIALSKLPPVTSTQRWIPVSEGLPKITGFYLIQYSREICGDEITVAYYSVEEKESDPNYEWEFKPHCGEYKEVIAWMPLPKPYEPQESEDAAVAHKNLCDSCVTKGCIFQSGIIRNRCDFYKAESEGKNGNIQTINTKP